MKTLGIIGGLGPMSSVYFYELITENTLACRDQDHINIYLSSHASTPDRTSFILGRSDESPLPEMLDSLAKLEKCGCDIIAIPCNTAHFFYDALHAATKLPILNIISETVTHIKECGFEKVGIMATDGTIKSASYQNALKKEGIESVIPSEASQAAITDIIYNSVKKGKAPDMESFFAVAEELRKNGAQSVILGCTELSLLSKNNILPDFFTDALKVLALNCINACGAKSAASVL